MRNASANPVGGTTLSKMRLFRKFNIDEPLFVNMVPSQANRDCCVIGGTASEIPPRLLLLMLACKMSTKV